MPKESKLEAQNGGENIHQTARPRQQSIHQSRRTVAKHPPEPTSSGTKSTQPTQQKWWQSIHPNSIMAAKHPPKHTVAKHPPQPRTVAKHPPNDHNLSSEASTQRKHQQHDSG